MDKKKLAVSSPCHINNTIVNKHERNKRMKDEKVGIKTR